MTSTEDPSADRDRVQRELGPNEHVLWSGRPRTGVAFRTGDLIQVPFSLMWGGFALFWEYSVWRTDAPAFFRLWGVPFVAVGLYLIAGRFLVDSWQRAATLYAVTNQRVLILNGLINRSTVSLTLRSVGEVSMNEKTDGSGSIAFGQSPFSSFFHGAGAWPGMPAQTGFDMLPNIRQVFDVLRQAQAAAR